MQTHVVLFWLLMLAVVVLPALFASLLLARPVRVKNSASGTAARGDHTRAKTG